MQLSTTRMQQVAAGAGATGNRTVGSRFRYEFILLVVVSTAVITWQIALVSIFPGCDRQPDAVDNDGSGVFDRPRWISDVLATSLDGDRQKSAGSKAAAAAAAAVVTKPKEAIGISNEQYSFETIPSRTWKIYKDPFPCYPLGILPPVRMQSTKPCSEGILFQRPLKVGSTTMTNIVLRMAFNRGQKAANQELRNRKAALSGNQTKLKDQLQQPQSMRDIIQKWKTPAMCQHRSNHGTSVEYEYAQRNKEKSFLFSLVRDPTKRITSAFFHFIVTYLQVEPTDQNFIQYAITPQKNNVLVRDLTFDPKLSETMSKEFLLYAEEWKSKQQRGVANKKQQHHEGVVAAQPPLNYTKIVGDILDNYDFIAVTERMDESLVALKILMGLSVEEILYAKISRSAGSFSNGPNERPCMYIVPSFLSDGMKDFFYTPTKNDRWIEYTKGDALLHRAAIKSLDRTIDQVFGREFFEEELKEFRNALRYAQAVCSSEPDLVLTQCDGAGNRVGLDKNRSTTCYIWSEGCDHKCLNERVPTPMPRAILEGIQLFGE